MKTLTLLAICAVGMAFGQTKIQVDADKWQIARSEKFIPMIVDKNGEVQHHWMSTLRERLNCPEYMWIVIDGRVKGAYCALRAPEPAESIKLPIPKELRH